MRCIAVVAIALALLSPALECQTQDRPGVPEIRHHVVVSKNVDETYWILVSLPEEYTESQDSYPVLYVLDAEKSFGLVRDVADWLSWAGEMPRTIVVGISYGATRDQWSQKRSRDLTPQQDRSKVWGEWPLAGGAEAFRRFLSLELFPLIETKYRASADRALIGISFGGLFGAYDLLAPDRHFGRYLLVSPAYVWDYEAILKTEAEYGRQSSSLPVAIYSAVGTGDQDLVKEPWKRFVAQLTGRNYTGLRLKSEAFQGETHVSVFPVAVTHGLKWLFKADAG